MSERRDLSWEALVEVTGTTDLTPSQRGAMNHALAEIRQAMPHLEDDELAEVIRYRAKAYRKAMPEINLTATALAKHWGNVEAMAKPAPAPIIAPAVDPGWSLCGLCSNGAWVFLDGSQDVAPCPECNRGRKAEIAAYGREGAFWDGRSWARGEGPQAVVLS